MNNHKTIVLRNDIYDRLKSKTNIKGGNDVTKISFSDVIEKALDDQLRYQKKKIPMKV